MTATATRKYTCALCGKSDRAEHLTFSRFTGNRYCIDYRACERRAKRAKRMTLTPVEIEETTQELVVLLARERRLMEVEPINDLARERRDETLERVRGEIIRVARLLGEAPTYPDIPLQSRKAPT